jgi:hypothetical protein
MKKLFTLVAAAVMAMAANATDYTDDLAITLNGVATAPTSAKITVTPVEGSDGLYDIVLNQFTFMGDFLIGDVTIEDVKGNDTAGGDGYTYFEPITKEAAITNAEGSYIAPMLGYKVTVTIKEGSKMNDKDLYLLIELPVAYGDNHFDVSAVFGTGGYQIPNSGFENFHTATYVDGNNEYSSQEPNAWHSFNSGVAITGSGLLGGMTKQALRYGSTSIAEETRPGSLGNNSALLKSAFIIIQPANGTMTTGRMQAGSTTPADPANCAFLDFDNEEVDGNGDPFYTVMNGRPDSLAVWVKFKQGTIKESDADYKYATVSAVITDGTYYQDPEDPEETYTNVVAKAQNAQIESKDFTWQRISIPFDYDTYASNGAATKAILVTISTNAQPGVGSKDSSNPDMLYVDDIELIYNANLTSFNIKGQDITFEDGTNELDIYSFTDELTADDVTVTSDGRGAIINKTVEQTDGGYKVTVTVTSNDYKTSSTYTVNLYKAAGEPMSFTDKMNVTMGDSPVATDLEATITIQEQADGTYTLSLKNFMLGESGVGNITVEGVTSAEEGGVQTLSVENAAITITEGDIEGVDWSFGQFLAQKGLKANISGEIENGKLNVKIEIPDVLVTVLFGENYTSGINEVTTVTENGTEAIYDLGGRKLNEMQNGINIVRKADGTTVKVLKK